MIRGYGPDDILVSEETSMELIGIGDERNMMVIGRRKERTMVGPIQDEVSRTFIEQVEMHTERAQQLTQEVTDPGHKEVISEDLRRRIAATCIQCGFFNGVSWLIEHLHNSDRCAQRYSNY